MSAIPTKTVWYKPTNKKMIINVEDFNPEIHEDYVEGKTKEVKPAPKPVETKVEKAPEPKEVKEVPVVEKAAKVAPIAKKDDSRGNNKKGNYKNRR